MATKHKLIGLAWTALGLPGSVYTITAEQYEDSLAQLDMMVAQWAEAYGVNFAYDFEAAGEVECGIGKGDELAVVMNLSLMIASALGKVPPEHVVASAASALSGLIARAAQPPQVQLPHALPRGAGAKPHRQAPSRRFTPAPDLEPLAGSSTTLTFQPE